MFGLQDQILSKTLLAFYSRNMIWFRYNGKIHGYINNPKSDLFIKSLIGSQVVGLNIILMESNKTLVYKVKVQNK